MTINIKGDCHKFVNLLMGLNKRHAITNPRGFVPCIDGLIKSEKVLDYNFLTVITEYGSVISYELRDDNYSFVDITDELCDKIMEVLENDK